MSRIESVLVDYLQRETNHAILLTGNWGSGKTHFIKTIFFEKARNIQTIGSGAERNYRPILISLFGVKSIEDIKDKIWMALYPFFNNRHTFNGASILKSVIKSVDISKLLGSEGLFGGAIESIDEAYTGIKNKAKEELNFDNLLLCFDDLERTNKEHLRDDELLGFVNSLVEHDNNKIILIANESKMSSKRFKKIKEKTIGYTLHFEQSFPEVFDSFISSYDSSSTFKLYISKQYEIIYRIFTKQGQENINYRTLKHFLSVFSQVFHLIEAAGLGIAAIENLKESIMTDILKFTLGLCIEFRKGEISYKERQNLEQFDTLALSKILGKKDYETTYLDKFINSYIGDENQYMFYRSLYETVTGGSTFVLDALRQELRKKYHVVENEIPVHYKIYNKLLRPDYLNIEDLEYKNVLRNLRDYAEQGLYRIEEYPTIHYILMRDGNPLYLSEVRLTKKFIKVIAKKKANHKYHPLLPKYFSSDPENPSNKSQQALVHKILEINAEAGKQENESKIKNLKELFIKNFDEYFQMVLSSSYQQSNYLFLEGFTASYLYNAFCHMSNQNKQNFLELLYICFLENNHVVPVNEIEMLKDLKMKVGKDLTKNNSRNNSTVLKRKLEEVLKEILTSKDNF